MEKTMSPSAKTLTDGQIVKLTDQIRDKLRKSNLPSEASQQVIEAQGEAIAIQLVNDFRKRVETISNMVVRHVTVDRSLKPEAVLDATERAKYTDKKVVQSMPKGEGNETDVCFFTVGRYLSDEELEKEYASRGLVPADPYSQAAVNRDDKTFADDHPNGTHWKDADGKWCFAAFRRWRGERHVYVFRSYDEWHDGWWFAGVRK
ncbi:MAG: hypothetical protein AAB515_03365 [Patescibacteria group bacterium]